MPGVSRLGPDGKIGETEVVLSDHSKESCRHAANRLEADKQFTFEHGVSTQVKLATNTLSKYDPIGKRDNFRVRTGADLDHIASL